MKKIHLFLKAVFASLTVLMLCMSAFAQDAGISTIVSPQTTGTLSSITAYILQLKLSNYGTTVLSSVPVSYSINGTVTNTGNWTGTLLPGDSVQIMVSPPFSLQNGSNTICVYTVLPGDLDNSNDTTCSVVMALPMVQLPYYTDFEGTPPAGWNVNTPAPDPTQWEWGVPSYNQTNSVHSGSFAFDIDLDSSYSPGTDYLETPYFDFSQSDNPLLSFWQNRDLTPGEDDGLRIDYTLDQGLTWITLGSVGEPGSVNWYTIDSMASNGEPAWDSTSANWEKSQIEIPALAFYPQPVRFRYAFNADAGNPSSGLSIDDFQVAGDSLYMGFIGYPPACNGDSGSIASFPVGGVFPYTYLWSNGVTTQSNSGILAGTYTVTVTDANNTTTSGSYILTEPSLIVISTSSSPAACAQSNGSASFIVTGGVPPYNYIWNLFPGNSTNTLTGVPAGSYTFYITDSYGCLVTGNVVIGTATPLNVQQTVSQNPTSCSLCDGTVSLAASSGTPPYLYAWSNGATTQTVSNLCTGLYSCTVTDASGCTLFITGQLQTPAFDVIATSVAAGCGQNNGLASANVIGGTAPYTFHWSTGLIQQTLIGLTAGVYSVSVTDAFSCWATSTVIVDDTCHGVWPGDANYDLSADNNDLLSIGLAYGSMGPVRPSASLNWVAQPCPQWSNSFISGANYKNADCNGDGIIDDNDTTAILQNYGLNHAFKLIPVPAFLPGQPVLYLQVSSDTTGLSDTVTIDVLLGNAGAPIDSIYGLAFSINTDPSLVDSNSGNVDFSNCWIGTAGTNLLAISKNRLSEGAIDIGIVRTDHANVSGNGVIARATVVTTDNIAGKGITPSAVQLNFTVSGLTAIIANEHEILLNQGGDSLIIDSAFAQGIQQVQFEKYFQVFPNPSDGRFLIRNGGKAEPYEITVSDMVGNVIMETVMNTASLSIDLSENNSGIYFLSVRSPKGILNKKLVIAR
jgi:hypothetical protein